MRRKVRIGATISPVTLRWLNEMTEEDGFSSRSDAVEKSLEMMYYSRKHEHESLAIAGV